MGKSMFKVLAQCVLLSFAFASSAAVAEPIKLKLAFFTSDRTMAYESVVKPFVDAINAGAKGSLDIEVYFSGALGKSQAKTAHSVLNGVADIAFVVPGLAPDLFYDNTIIELPGLFRDTNEATFVFTRLLAANAIKGYEDFLVLGAFATEPETVHTRPLVATLNDLQGKKIGTNSEIEAAALRKLGMQPVILPVTEFSEAITSGNIDGVGKSPSILFDFGIARVATHHYFLGTSAVPLLLLMNRKIFDDLPTQSQDIIRKYSGEWAAARFVEIYGAANQRAIEKLTADPRRTVIFPSQADLDTAQRAYQSLIAEWVEKDPRHFELLKTVETEIAKLRANR
jgi:TRAP-type C4-dicarboxylate transport system substrate-binding protein